MKTYEDEMMKKKHFVTIIIQYELVNGEIKLRRGNIIINTTDGAEMFPFLFGRTF